MIFKKKNKMIDIGELQKQGKIRSPEETPRTIQTNNEGFVEVNSHKTIKESPSSNTNFFGFMDSPSTESTTQNNSDNYSKREVDSKIQRLDNILYKLEQRIELIERKLNINEY